MPLWPKNKKKYIKCTLVQFIASWIQKLPSTGWSIILVSRLMFDTPDFPKRRLFNTPDFSKKTKFNTPEKNVKYP